MSSGCGDVLSLEDLKTAKLHQLFEAEVITGKAGGQPGGANIDYATNLVTGQVQKTLPAVLRDSGYQTASFDFASGGTIAVGERNKAVLWPLSAGGDGDYYYWEGVLPKVIPAASTPATTGGVAVGAWRPVGDISLRGQLADVGSVGYGDGLLGVKSTLPGSAGRTQHAKNADSISILDFSGADPSGTADSTSAFVAAMVAGRTLHIPSGVNIKVSLTTPISGHLILDGTLTVNANSTFGCQVTVRAGSITVGAGFIASFTGSFTAPSGRTIFNGPGAVYGLRHVEPEWWGAVADNSTDCSSALNSASTCIANSVAVVGEVRPTIMLQSGRYRIASTWVIPMSANCGAEVKGQGVIFAGTRIVAAATFTGDKAVYIPALADGTQRIVDFKLSDFGIVPQTPGSGPAFGLQIGTDNLMMNGLRESHVENIYLENFPTSLRLLNARLIKFSRVGIWHEGISTASTNMLIQSVGKFAGDLSFENCQFVNRQSISGSRGVHITSNGAFDTTGDRAYQIAGIRFTECIFYPADQTVYIAALGGSHIEDIFIVNCQFDGDSNSMVYAVASGTGSQINDIQIVHNYMYGGNKSVSAAQIQFVTGSTGSMSNIRIESNTLGNGVGRAVNTTTGSIPSITGVIVSSNNIVNFNNTSTPAIEIGSGVTRAQLNNNIATRSGTAFFPYLIQIDAGANYYVVTGNLGAGIVSSATVNEVSAGANRIVANNL